MIGAYSNIILDIKALQATFNTPDITETCAI